MTQKRIKMLLVPAIIFLTQATLFAQIRHITIEWKPEKSMFPGSFKGAQALFYAKDKYYPVWSYTELTGQSTFEVAITNEVYEPISANPVFIDYLQHVQYFTYGNGIEHGVNRLKIQIIPFRAINNGLERLVSFDLVISKGANIQQKLSKKGNKTESVLATGDWYKIKIKEDGAYKLDKTFFTKNGLNAEGIKLSTFKIYGNGGEMLAEEMTTNRIDDLLENAIQVQDANSNDKLDDGDFISFYAKGPDTWINTQFDFRHQKNVFSDYSYYFFTFGGANGKRISESGNGQGNTVLKTINESEFLYVHEDESVNLRKSGREWFGEVLTIENKTFSVSIPDVIFTTNLKLKSEVAIRTAIPTFVNVFLNADDVPIIEHYGNPVEYDGDGNFADIANKTVSLSPKSSFQLTYEFIRPQLGSEAWLNYFEIQARRELKTIDGQIHFFNSDTKVDGNMEYQVKDFNTNFTLWDVTDFSNISLQKTYESGGFSSFIANGRGQLLKFLVFKKGSEKIPEMVGKIENQNLHAFTPVDFIIISHPDFKNQAEKLAKFHEEKDGYTYLIAYPEKIYNEFASGSPDITGIRDFVKMIYERESDPLKKPKGLLLFGDASYDYKNKLGNGNFIPTFESYEFNNSVSSHCSDDYFVILDDNEGNWAKSPTSNFAFLDMGIGRLPAKSLFEAEVMVDKCIHYKTKSNRGEWRSSVTFLADDEDGNTHLEDSEGLSTLVESKMPSANINKIYFDAFKQVSLGNGNSYPEVNEAINSSISRGSLVFNYLGHGGGSGMGHERVVTRPQIMGWKNYDKLCFFVTGTCDLAQYDNPAEESPGELMMINNEGGAVGMMTTTRKVYIGLNTEFASNLYTDNLFKRSGSHFTTFGEAYAMVKSKMINSENVRNYVMLGDPMLDLNIPIEKTFITAINSIKLDPLRKDTLKALAKIEIEGMVTNNSDVLLSDFNGDVSITLFDKKQTFKSLGNDPDSYIVPFNMRNNVLYRGKASVKNGIFKVSFILPKDIDYSVGKGRIYAYAYNDKTDAVGIYDSALVGGTTSVLTADNKGPELDVFLEDEKFVNGGIVSKTPLLIVKLWDENGINTAGNGVGREILATLDKGTPNAKNYILNDFYSTAIDSYQGGEVRFKMEDIAPGKHTLVLRAWDVYNNSNVSEIEFVVAKNENMAISNLLNYPNPFTSKTNIHFDHNKAGQELSVAVNILSVSGKVVKTLYAKIPNASSHISEIEWDGKDEYGQNLSRGVYLYSVKVKSEDGKTEQEFQKMVLLK
jgi:hypothetical protein